MHLFFPVGGSIVFHNHWSYFLSYNSSIMWWQLAQSCIFRTALLFLLFGNRNCLLYINLGFITFAFFFQYSSKNIFNMEKLYFLQHFKNVEISHFAIRANLKISILAIKLLSFLRMFVILRLLNFLFRLLIVFNIVFSWKKEHYLFHDLSQLYYWRTNALIHIFIWKHNVY